MAGNQTPFKVSVPDEAIEQLKQRLSFAKFPSQLESERLWDFGPPVSELKRLTTYWKDKFDWKKAEAMINQFPQFTTTIDVEDFGDLEIHCWYPVKTELGKNLTSYSCTSNKSYQRCDSVAFLTWL